MRRSKKRSGRQLLLGLLWCLLAGTGCVLGIMSFKESAGKASDGVSGHGALHVEGQHLKDEQGDTVVLRGMSSHGIEWYPRYLNGGAMKTLRSQGANVQRISMYTDTYDGYVRKPEENLNYLYMGIESVLAADMYAIVDWHILEDGNPLQYVNEAMDFFGQLSAHYGNHPGLIYEICNEPNGDTTWEDVTAYADQVIPVIRKNAPDALVLVGVPNYCTDFSGPMENPLAWDNFMYTMHQYIDTAKEKPCRIDLIEKVFEAGLPVFVSEWGTGIDWVQETESAPRTEGLAAAVNMPYQENARPFLDYMAEKQISWTAWALSNGDSYHSIIKPDCSKLSGWQEEDLTSFGKLIFAELGRQVK